MIILYIVDVGGGRENITKQKVSRLAKAYQCVHGEGKF